MEVDMKVGGLIIKPMEGVDLFMQMVMFTKENGVMTKQMALEFISIWMGHSMRVSGRKTNRMERELNDGQMELVMKETTFRERKME
jgi:hypothetical protein